ncbi:MAG: hypothetical protein GXP58_03110 [Deltaproteobacteria bacterium]|nr:hypothetical protein [Deltaproteobacteria bacterium]
MKFSDRVLIEGLRSKDEKAFLIFYETFFPRVFNYLNDSLGKRKKAEKLTEAVLTEVLQSLDERPRRLTLNEWFFQVTRRRLAEYRSKNDFHAVDRIRIGGEEVADFFRFEEMLLQSVSQR